MAEEVDPVVLRKTQEILGSVIKKPPLTEKHLKRPPFRFLHDVITNVIKATGFMKGLYAPEEMVSDNIKDKDSKIAFLQKAVDLLALATDQTISVKPSKVVAGHEATKTNEFLQLLGAAVKSKVDTKEAVRALLHKESPIKPTKERRQSVDKRASQKQAPEKAHNRSSTRTLEPAKKTSQSTNKESKNHEADKTRSRSKDGRSKEKEKPKEKSRSKREDSKSRSKSESKKDKSSKHSKDATQETDAIESPRKKPSALQNGYLEDHVPAEVMDMTVVDGLEDHLEAPNAEEVRPDEETAFPAEANGMMNGQQEEMPQFAEEKKHHAPSTHQSRPPSARSKRTKLDAAAPASHRESSPNKTFDIHSNEGLASPVPRPTSTRPSSSRPAPPRIRIRHIVENEEPLTRPETAKLVENVIVDQKLQSDEEDEDETFVVAAEDPSDMLSTQMAPLSTSEEITDADQGSLVRQLLETKRDLEGGSQISKKVEIDKSQVTQKSRDPTNKELQQLQSFIQGVSKVAYPLGRMLDYLQEDVDSMKMELKVWQNEHKQNLIALNKEKNITETALQPLRVQLDDLDQLVQDQIDANSALKATILRNDERISRMITSIRRKS